MHNLLSLPILCFICGYFLKPIAAATNACALSHQPKSGTFKASIDAFQLAIAKTLLFLIGLKGGISLANYADLTLLTPLAWLMAVGFLQPFIGYFFLRKMTLLDAPTAAAVAASFGSVSIMTFVSGVAFLEKLGVEHEPFLVAAAALMELPAIISGVLIFKYLHQQSTPWLQLFTEAIWNPTIALLLLGMFLGLSLVSCGFEENLRFIPLLFKTCLCFFLLNMGALVYQHKENLRKISCKLLSFGLYMPMLGAFIGLFLSYFLHLNVGSATLVALLTGSASYIAVPAAMRALIPQAQETIYVPLALAITFPFNILIGIPLYYQIALTFMG